MWFSGAHSDVGGGYRDDNWSDIALGWIANEAHDQGLQLNKGFTNECRNPRATINQEDKGVFAVRPTVREALSLRHRLSDVTRDSFEVHRSVINRLVESESTRYGFAKRFVKRLKRVDDFSLQLAFEIRIKKLEAAGLAGNVIPAWCKDVRAEVAIGANERIAAFIENSGLGLTDEQKTAFNKSLCVLFLANDVQRLKYIIGKIVETNKRQKDLPLSDDLNAPDEAVAWLARARALVETGVECIVFLSQERQREIKDVFDLLDSGVQELSASRKLQRIRRLPRQLVIRKK